jgi:hypothetical protein
MIDVFSGNWVPGGSDEVGDSGHLFCVDWVGVVGVWRPDNRS